MHFHAFHSWRLHNRQLLFFSVAPRSPPTLSISTSFTFKLLLTSISLFCILSFPLFYPPLQQHFKVTSEAELVSDPNIYEVFSSLRKSDSKKPSISREEWLRSYGNFSKKKTVSAAEVASADPALRAGFCDYTDGKWMPDPDKNAPYPSDCAFSRNSWKCGKNQRPGVGDMVSWRWMPKVCNISSIDGLAFLRAMRNQRIGFIGDSLNENFMVALLCTLQVADKGTRRWKKRGAWKGAFFPSFNVTVGYHRAVLLAKYSEWQPRSPEWPLDELKVERAYRVDVDVPDGSWENVIQFYDFFIFNTGH